MRAKGLSKGRRSNEKSLERVTDSTAARFPPSVRVGMEEAMPVIWNPLLRVYHHTYQFRPPMVRVVPLLSNVFLTC